jgi:YHS domain-containing protein
MKKFITALVAIACVGSFTPLIAAKAAATTSASKATAVLICPVTGNKIKSVKDAVGHSVYKGKTYYFCCPACKPKFDKNPAKYIQAMKVRASDAKDSTKSCPAPTR